MPTAKKATAPIHIPRFGCVSAFYFDQGGYARVKMNTSDVTRLLGALSRYVLRKQRLPQPKLLAALETLQKYFSVAGRGNDITVTADMVIAQQGVSLRPILSPVDAAAVRKPRPSQKPTNP